MNERRYGELIDLLEDKTDSGRVAWEATVSPGVFMAAFPNSVVRIYRGKTSMGVPGVYLAILDEDGNEVDRFNQFEESLPWGAAEKLETLYNNVKRQVMSADRTIAAIIENLKKAS